MKFRKFAAVAVLVLSSFAANNVAPSKAELEAMYDKAFREFDANNFSEALKNLDAIDARQPDLAESQNLRGVILMREGIYDKAEAALHEALRIDPKFWNARFNLAEIPFLQKNWVDARKRFEDLLSSNVSELQGEAAQLIQYKILLTYLLEGKENMVDSILAKFELSPDTPAVHYSNAAIALQKKDAKGAKDWMSAAEKNFSPQLNKLFAESLYEIGWLEKQTGQSRAALELTSASERAAKTKQFAHSRYEQAQQALAQRDFDTARKFIDEADSSDPNQPMVLNLRGEILMEQKQFDEAEAAFKKALKIDPKFRQAQYNLAQLPFKKKDYAKARDRFEALFSQTPGGDKNQAAQLIKFKIFMTFLLEGKESRAQKMMEQFQFTGDTPALYYAQAAWEFKHNNPNKANDWIESAKKIYSPSLNSIFGDSFYDLAWLQTPSMTGSPAPAAEAAAAVMSAQTESSPAIEPSPIPGTAVASAKGAKDTKLELAASSPTIPGMEGTTSQLGELPVISAAPNVAANESIASGTPARPEDMSAMAAPAMSPTVETPVSPSPAASVAETMTTAATTTVAKESEPAATESESFAAASSTPATSLAPAKLGESRQTSSWLNVRVLIYSGIVAALLGLLTFIYPEIKRRGLSLPVQPTLAPATGPRLQGNAGAVAATGAAKTRFVGGPRQVSLQLKASEPALRRSVRPATKPTFGGSPAVTAFAPAPAIAPTPEVYRAPQPTFEPAPAPVLEPEPVAESVGPVVESIDGSVGQVFEQPAEFAPEPIAFAEPEPVAVAEPEPVAFVEPEPVAFTETVAEPEIISAPAPEIPAMPQWADFAPISSAFAAPLVSEPVAEPQFEPLAPEPAPEMPEPFFEPIGQGQPIPYQMPVEVEQMPVELESFTTEVTNPKVEDTVPPILTDFAPDAFVADLGVLRQSVENPAIEVVNEPSIFQPTTSIIMPEPVQTPTAPVIRTPTAGGTPQAAGAMHTAVHLTFSFEIASMQLTPTFKMGALQLRPSSKVVTMRLAPSQQPQPAMNLQVNFEISKIQPTGGGLGTVRLMPSQQQRPAMTGSPSFTVAGLQLVSNFEAAPVQLTPSTQAGVLVTSSFQIATVEFSPSFEIASIVLNATSKNVGVQLPGAPAADGAPTFEIANLQLGASGDIGLMQINLMGQARR